MISWDGRCLDEELICRCMIETADVRDGLVQGTLDSLIVEWPHARFYRIIYTRSPLIATLTRP